MNSLDFISQAETETSSMTQMLRSLQIFVCFLGLISFVYFYRHTIKPRNFQFRIMFKAMDATSSRPGNPRNIVNGGDNIFILNITSELYNNTKPMNSYEVNSSYILRHGNGIIFLESGNRTQPPALVLCALESAARVYPERPIVFFINGLSDVNTKYDEENIRRKFPTLSLFPNVYIFPLKLEEVFKDTPLQSWFQKVNPKKERFWVHVSSDGCRLALVWKYGGIYMDSDFISIKPIPYRNFLAAAAASHLSSNGIFGLFAHHYFAWDAMEDFVKNYKGAIWAHQGPKLFSRVLEKYCVIPKRKRTEDFMCGNISFLNPQRFYPIAFPQWKKYYQVWERLPTFNTSYGLHLWNTMNKGQMTMIVGTKTLVERLYQQHCPTTYEALRINETVPL